MANTPHILLQIRVDAADPPGLSKLAVGARSRCALGPTAKTPRTKHDPLKIPPRVPTPVGPTSLPLYIRLITNASEKKLRKEREREESFVASSRECEANRERSRYQIPISQPESPPPTFLVSICSSANRILCFFFSNFTGNCRIRHSPTSKRGVDWLVKAPHLAAEISLSSLRWVAGEVAAGEAWGWRWRRRGWGLCTRPPTTRRWCPSTCSSRCSAPASSSATSSRRIAGSMSPSPRSSS